MIFWPYQKYVVASKLSSEQLKRKFDVAPNFSSNPNVRATLFGNNTVQFDCQLYPNYLKVREYNDGRKITPEAEILFNDTAQGTYYMIIFRLRKKTKLFFIVILLFLFLGLNAIILNNSPKEESSGAPFILLMMALLAYYIVISGFSSNKLQLESFIWNLLEVGAQA